MSVFSEPFGDFFSRFLRCFQWLVYNMFANYKSINLEATQHNTNAYFFGNEKCSQIIIIVKQ